MSFVSFSPRLPESLPMPMDHDAPSQGAGTPSVSSLAGPIVVSQSSLEASEKSQEGNSAKFIAQANALDQAFKEHSKTFQAYLQNISTCAAEELEGEMAQDLGDELEKIHTSFSAFRKEVIVLQTGVEMALSQGASLELKSLLRRIHVKINCQLQVLQKDLDFSQFYFDLLIGDNAQEFIDKLILDCVETMDQFLDVIEDIKKTGPTAEKLHQLKLFKNTQENILLWIEETEDEEVGEIAFFLRSFFEKMETLVAQAKQSQTIIPTSTSLEIFTAFSKGKDEVNDLLLRYEQKCNALKRLISNPEFIKKLPFIIQVLQEECVDLRNRIMEAIKRLDTTFTPLVESLSEDHCALIDKQMNILRGDLGTLREFFDKLCSAHPIPFLDLGKNLKLQKVAKAFLDFEHIRHMIVTRGFSEEQVEHLKAKEQICKQQIKALVDSLNPEKNAPLLAMLKDLFQLIRPMAKETPTLRFQVQIEEFRARISTMRFSDLRKGGKFEDFIEKEWARITRSKRWTTLIDPTIYKHAEEIIKSVIGPLPPSIFPPASGTAASMNLTADPSPKES